MALKFSINFLRFDEAKQREFNLKAKIVKAINLRLDIDINFENY